MVGKQQSRGCPGELLNVCACLCLHLCPGCYNYTLRKTVVGNASDFNVEVAETLIKKVLC